MPVSLSSGKNALITRETDNCYVFILNPTIRNCKHIKVYSWQYHTYDESKRWTRIEGQDMSKNGFPFVEIYRFEEFPADADLEQPIKAVNLNGLLHITTLKKMSRSKEKQIVKVQSVSGKDATGKIESSEEYKKSPKVQNVFMNFVNKITTHLQRYKSSKDNALARTEVDNCYVFIVNPTIPNCTHIQVDDSLVNRGKHLTPKRWIVIYGQNAKITGSSFVEMARFDMSHANAVDLKEGIKAVNFNGLLQVTVKMMRMRSKEQIVEVQFVSGNDAAAW